MTLDPQRFRKQLTALDPPQIREKIALHNWGKEKVEYAQLYLSELEDKSSSEKDSRTEGREELAIRIANEANRLASEANASTRRAVRIDRFIAITAVIIAATAAREDIKWLISWLVKQIIKTP
jgi:hypothetical protein